MPDSLESLQHYLQASDGAGKLMAHARLLIQLRHAYQEIAPNYLHQASVPANYRNDASNRRIVVIHAQNGAVAAKLRQIAPRLAEGFCKRGVECNEVQVKVQASRTTPPSPDPRCKPLSARTYDTLARLRDDLPQRGALQRSLSILLARCALKE